MNCNKCGKELAEGVTVCPECGSPVEATLAEERQSEEAPAYTEAAFSGTAVQEEPKKSQKPVYITIGVLVLALIAAGAFLAVNIFGKKSLEDQVREAYENTVRVLNGQNAELTALMEAENLSEEISLTVEEAQADVYGQKFSLRDMFGSIGMRIETKRDAEMERFGIGLSLAGGDEIKMDMTFDDENCYYSFPGLYDGTLKTAWEDILETNNIYFASANPAAAMDYSAMMKAGNSLVNTMTDAFVQQLSKMSFKENGKVTLQGEAAVEAREIEITMKAADFDAFIKSIPDLLENDTILIDWLTDLTSEEEVKNMLDSLRDDLETIEAASEEALIMAYVYINKDKELVQVKIPLTDEETDGNVIISFLGEENLGDYIQYSVEMTSYGETIRLSYLYQKEDSHFDITAVMEAPESLGIKFASSGSMEQSEKGYEVFYDKLEISGSVDTITFGCEMTGSYKLATGGMVEPIDKASAIDAMAMSEEESEEFLALLLGNLIQGNYIPEEYREYFQSLLYYSGLGSDAVSTKPDASEYMSYEEFKAWVMETYGEIYTEEELQYLYTNFYDGTEKSTAELNENGNIVLTDYDYQYAVELIAPENTVMDEYYSDETGAYYTSADGNIHYYFSISWETLDEFEESVGWWKENIEELEYENVEFSDMKKKTINGYEVYCLSYSYEYGEGLGGLKVYEACVPLDEEYSFRVSVEDYTMSTGEEVLENCFESILPVS